jgi:AcrR family transcriptional regulator
VENWPLDMVVFTHYCNGKGVMVMVVKRGKRAPKQAAEVRRETVLDAAIRVFARTSYRGAGTAEIAQEAGVAEPTIYRYFDSKRALYLAALERCGAIIVDTFRSIADQTPIAHEALGAMGDWYSHNVVTDPEYLRLRQRAVAETDDDEIREIQRRVYEDVRDIVSGVIRRGQSQGVFSLNVSPDSAAWMFIAIGQVLDLGRLIGLSEEEALQSCMDLGAIFKRALGVRSA